MRCRLLEDKLDVLALLCTGIGCQSWTVTYCQLVFAYTPGSKFCVLLPSRYKGVIRQTLFWVIIALETCKKWGHGSPGG